MNEPMTEIVLNGTNSAYQAGRISYNEAAALKQEQMAAAFLSETPRLQVTIHAEDLGDEDCRKIVWLVYRGRQALAGGFESEQEAVEHCRKQGWEILADLY
jgi:hypothetical protein